MAGMVKWRLLLPSGAALLSLTVHAADVDETADG